MSTGATDRPNLAATFLHLGVGRPTSTGRPTRRRPSTCSRGSSATGRAPYWISARARWHPGLLEVIRRHSRHPFYAADFSLLDALAASPLWVEAGRVRTTAVPFRRRVSDYIEGFHSTSSLARELMPAGEASAFHAEVAGLVRPYARDGMLQLDVVADLAWGRITGETPPDLGG